MALLATLISVAPTAARAAPDAGWIGVVVSERTTELVATVAGTVRTLSVRPGAEVTAGQLLVDIDSLDAQHTLVVRGAELRQAEADHRRLAREFEQRRGDYARRLAAQQLISKEALEGAQLQAAAAQAASQAAAAAIERLRALHANDRRLLSEAKVRAPFAGRVAAVYVNAVDTVNAGARLVRLVGQDDVFVRFAVDPVSAHALPLGMAVEVSPEGGGHARRASISETAPEVDAAAQMVFVGARFDQAQAALLIGTAVRVRPLTAKPADPSR